LTDARFADAAKQAANSAELTAILDQTFVAQPMAHWHEVFERSHLTFGVVVAPSEVIKDKQLRANDIVVPLDGAGGNLRFTISSPLQVHDMAKVPARRAPELGEHSEEILGQLGFSSNDIAALHASGAVPNARGRAA
jgi:formyl-CoA transferase